MNLWFMVTSVWWMFDKVINLKPNFSFVLVEPADCSFRSFFTHYFHKLLQTSWLHQGVSIRRMCTHTHTQPHLTQIDCWFLNLWKCTICKKVCVHTHTQPSPHSIVKDQTQQTVRLAGLLQCWQGPRVSAQWSVERRVRVDLTSRPGAPRKVPFQPSAFLRRNSLRCAAHLMVSQGFLGHRHESSIFA